MFAHIINWFQNSFLVSQYFIFTGNAHSNIRCGFGSYLFFVWSQTKNSQRAAGSAAGSGRKLWGGASLGRGWRHQGLIG